MANLERMDWCELVKDTKSTKNGFAKNLFADMKKLAPDAFRECPLFGIYEVKNFTFAKSFANLLPIGSYMIRYNAYGGSINRNLYNMTIVFDVCAD